ncbi:ligand-dependent nuclear receptor corepressor-like protein isoform X2 [Apostichopus japonicus]|uniref:ligand-dependent nuclear receptor corepressor-like protein isoform X2 n=1 Tax=Stichopus japonicus TaxID=307972 RepID=UPI003AB625D4
MTSRVKSIFMKMAVYATCGKQRCLQERKQLRKELERGRKTVISYIGLESIIEGIFGAEFINEVSPLKACDEFKTDDWQGDKENCALCAARQEIVQETIARHESYLGNLLEGKDHQITAEERLRRAQQWLTESVYQATADITEDHLDEEGQQKLPLDLSKSAALVIGAGTKDYLYREELTVPKAYTSGSKTSQEPLKVPAITMHKTQTKGTRPHRTLGSSNYTQDDLKLALQEVRQGKLGTRRAAMLYGIPRSTIRNHLHRMRDRAPVEGTATGGNKGTTDAQEIDYDSNDNAAKLRNFLRSRARGGSGKTFKMTKLQKCLDQAIIKDLVHTCAFMKDKTKEEENGDTALKEKYKEHSKAALGLPQDLFEHLIVRLIEVERVQSLNGREHKKKATKFLKDTSLLKQPNLTTDVDMKVPDFKAMLATMNNAGVAPGATAKKVSSEEAACLKMPSRIIKTEDRSSLSSNNNNNQGLLYEGSPDQSETRRNKRGRYRCYDGDSLLQAVDIVERGEMTIARASTYFGIPHSTLEYKVRERQIRRQQGHSLDPSSRQIAVDQLGIPAGFYVADVSGPRPFQSFAEKLRAMSEKQALQNRFGFHSQALDGQMPLLLAPGLPGDSSASAAAAMVADPAYYLLSKSPSPLPVPLPSSLRDQWALWAQKPLLSSPFFGLYHPAGFMVDPTSMGFHQQPPHPSLQPSSSSKSSMGEAINRLVEAHIYDSLQGKAGSHSSSSSPAETSDPLTRGTGKAPSDGGDVWKGRSGSPHSGMKRPHDSSGDSSSSGHKKPAMD